MLLKVTVLVFKSHSPGWLKPEYWVSVAHSNQKDRCPAIVPAALFTHTQMLNLESPSGCLTLAALDQELSSVASVNLDSAKWCNYGRPLLRECSIKLPISKHSLLQLVRLFCDRWRCQRRLLRYRDANIKIRYDAKLPNSLYLGHVWISCSTVSYIRKLSPK